MFLGVLIVLVKKVCLCLLSKKSKLKKLCVRKVCKRKRLFVLSFPNECNVASFASKMIQRSQKSKQDQTVACLAPCVDAEVPTGQPSAFEGSHKDQSLLEQPSDLTEPLAPDSEGSSVTKEEEQNKWLFSKRRKGRSCGKCVPILLNRKAKVNFAVDTNLREEEILVEESCSKKATQSMGRQQHCAASKTSLQKECPLRLRVKRCSSSPEMKPCEKVTASKKNCTSSLLEPKQNISSCLEEGKKSKKKCKNALVKSEVHPKLNNLIERDGSSAIGLESQEAIRKSSKRSVSKLRSLQRSQWLRGKIRSVKPEQKFLRNQDKRQRVKRGCLSSKIHAWSLQKRRGKPRKRDFTCKLQLPSIDSEGCEGNQVKVRSQKQRGSIGEGRNSLVKSQRFSSSNLRLVEPQEEQALQQKYKLCSVELAQTKSCEDLQALKQNCRCVLENVECLEDRQKCRSKATERKHRMVTRAILKANTCENDSETLDWNQEKSVAVEIPCSRIRNLEKQVAIGQIVDSAPTEGQLIARIRETWGKCSEKHGKDEIVTSPELKVKIQTSSKNTFPISSIFVYLIFGPVFLLCFDM